MNIVSPTLSQSSVGYTFPWYADLLFQDEYKIKCSNIQVIMDSQASLEWNAT